MLEPLLYILAGMTLLRITTDRCFCTVLTGTKQLIATTSCCIWRLVVVCRAMLMYK